MEYIIPYYTNREMDSLFVEDSVTGTTGSINATSLGLIDFSGKNSVSWGNRNLVSASQVNFSWGGGIGFFGQSPVSKPSGSNIVTAVSALGLASYSAITGSNLPNLIFNSTGITYNALSSQNIATPFILSGIISEFTQPSGSNFINSVTLSGLASQYVAPTSSNFYTNLNATNFISVNQITGNRVYHSIASAISVATQSAYYKSPYAAAVGLGFLSSNDIDIFLPLQAPVVAVSNAVSMFSNIPEIVSSSKVPTLGIFPWSDATFSSSVTLNFGLVPSFGGSVTKSISFNGTVSSSVLSWWNPASFSQSISGSPGVSSSLTVVSSSQITFGNNVEGFCFVGLPYGQYTVSGSPELSAICRGLAFRVLQITTTNATIQCINATQQDITQSPAPFRILAF